MAQNINLLLAILSFVYLTTANEYSLEVAKTLDNGLPAPGISNFRFTETEGALNVEFTINDVITDVNETSVYFANKEKEILEVIFTEGNVQFKKYVTPYRLDEGQPEPVSDEKVHPQGSSFAVNNDFLPRNVIAVSAGFINIEDDKGVIYNFYSIQNFGISIPDRLIVESYMPVLFPGTDSQDPPSDGDNGGTISDGSGNGGSASDGS